MAVKTVLSLMPPAQDSPSEPKCYGSPAKFTSKKECFRVERFPSIERLMNQAAIDLEEAAEEAERAKNASNEGEGEEEDGASVYTYKKSQYWSKEVEEKLGLGGADPYGLLELEERRWRASADEIRKAYRRLVLTHHPDKKQGEEAIKAAAAMKAKKEKKEKEKESNTENKKDNGEEEGGEEEEEDTEFKLLSASWDLLGNTESRRAYDSIDNFNDFLPTVFSAKKGRDFFSVFGPPFARQAKFSNKTPMPVLGDADTPNDAVNKFYKSWFDFTSWRDFALLAEHEYKEAEDREERRWMQRQNKNFTDRIKKDERQRVQTFIQLAYDNDPRIAAFKEQLSAEKAAAKEAKESAIKAKKDAEEAARNLIENEAKMASAAAEQAKSAEKSASAEVKREKEKMRSALKKAKKEFKTLGDTTWASRASDLEVAAAVLDLDALTKLMATLAVGVSDEATAALDAAVVAAMKQ